MKEFILALDQGTTSSRAIVFNRAGGVVAVAQQEFAQIYPQPGWVEHDAEEIWQTQLHCAQQALQRAGISGADVAALGITNQRETTLIWSRRSGKPIHNAIVWQDRRTAALCDELKRQGKAELFRSRTGLVLDAYFSATKIKWLLDHVADARRLAAAGELAFGTVDSWLLWRLSGGRVHATDASNASRTLLYDIHTGDWSSELLKIFEIPRILLPAVMPSQAAFGATAAEHFGAAIPITGVAGDQQAALFGQLCVTPGMAKNTYGTGCFLLMNTGAHAVASNNQLLTTIAWRRGGATSYALEGSVFVGGAVVQWLRDALHLIDHAAQIEALAASVPDSGGVYFVPAFTGLGAPHWDPHARGSILGLTRGSSAAHIARAALESIALQSADVLRAMQADAAVPLTELRVDGGAAANNLLMQLQADLLGVPVVRPKLTETTALGAAYLAGLEIGFWREPAQLESQWQVDRRFEPRAAPGWREQLQAGWQRAVQRAKGWSG